MSVLTLAVADAAAKTDVGLFGEIARRFQQGGWGMWPISLAAIFMVVILFDRITTLYIRARVDKESFLQGIKKHLFQGDLERALSFVASQKQTPLTAIVKAGLMNVPKGEAEVQASMDEAALRENPKLEKRTGYLAMIGNAAMLSGLLGTVSGLITCFEAVARVNPADRASILSAGISEAMNCTAFGLITAIPALIGYSILQGRTQKLIDDINEASVGVLNLVVENKEKLRIPSTKTLAAAGE